MRSRISVFECEIHRLWKTSSIVSLPVTSEKAQHCSFFHATTEQFRAESIKSAVSRVDDQHTSAQSIVDGGGRPKPRLLVLGKELEVQSLSGVYNTTTTSQSEGIADLIRSRRVNETYRATVINCRHRWLEYAV